MPSPSGGQSQRVVDIDQARLSLERTASRLASIGDPAADVIAAMALALEAQHHLAQAKPTGFSAAELKILAKQLGDVIDDVLLHRWVRFNRWGIAFGVALTVVMMAAAGAGGWWLHGTTVALFGLRQGSEQCADQSDGSRICWQGYYTRLPRPAP